MLSKISLLIICGSSILLLGVIRADDYQKWRGLSKLQDLDMVEVATWIEGLSENVTESLKYYWVNNELFYPYAAMVRLLFGIFNQEFKASNNISTTFLDGCEALIHYMIMKTFPIEGRKGGVRGTGQDRQTLRAAVQPLKSCFEKAEGKFADVYPARRRKRRSKSEFGLFSQIREKFQKIRTNKWFSKTTSSEEKPPKSSDKTEKNSNEVKGFSNLLKLRRFFPIGKNNSEEDDSHWMHKRYSYTMYHGVKKADDEKINTNIVMTDKEAGAENIAASVFWLIYELTKNTCDFNKGQLEVVSKGFDGIVGLVVSLYLYDAEDFAEEYERIFQLPVKQFESEWIKVENIVRSISKERKFTVRRPYTTDQSH